MTARAEGFWWVTLMLTAEHSERIKATPRDAQWPGMVYVSGAGSPQRFMDLDGGGLWPKDEIQVIEWGPYLGKEPQRYGIGREGVDEVLAALKASRLKS